MLYCSFCMVFSEVPNFSEPNPEVLAQANRPVSTHTRMIYTFYYTCYFLHLPSSPSPLPFSLFISSSSLQSKIESQNSSSVSQNSTPSVPTLTYSSNGCSPLSRNPTYGSTGQQTGRGTGGPGTDPKPTVSMGNSRDPRQGLKRKLHWFQTSTDLGPSAIFI